jgi:prepilin-type N-terminal cleavage/methylation domain-containing protein
MSKKPARSCGLEVFHATPGFSMVELLVVVAIIATVVAITLPIVSTALTSAKLRGGMGDLSGLFQNARNVAVRRNRISKVHFQVSNSRQIAYVDWYNCDTTNVWCGLGTSMPQIWLPPKFTQVDPPTGGAGVPTAMDAAACGSATTLDSTGTDDTYFNQMGIPCTYSGGTCSTAQAFVYYFNYAENANNPSWSALCVSPAGRIKAWYWTGSSWTN